MSNETRTLNEVLKALPSVSDATGKSLMMFDSNGNPGKFSPDLMLDNVFILCTQKLYRPGSWPAQQNAGSIADGVAIVEGGKILVVAPTESGASLLWSSAAVVGGATATDIYRTAANDLKGEDNTAQIIAHSSSSAVTNTASYAAGFCNLYSHGALGAGSWWLPSVGEMLIINANMAKINYCLGLISGATQLSATTYWTSTERNSSSAWFVNLGIFNLGLNGKNARYYKVRPVSTFF